MIRILLVIISLILSSIGGYQVYASDIGEPLDLGFYSRVHDNIDTTTDILRKKELSKYSTFAGFGGTCREKLSWLDREPMNESVLQNLIRGNLLLLSQIMSKNRQYGTSDTDSFANLVTCLGETYRKMGEVATKDENALAQMGLMGLYTDGDTANSDYDIVDDIEKINSILFTEPLEWIGTINTSKRAFENLALGDDVPSISGGSSDGGGSSNNNTSPQNPTTETTLENLGIGDICSVDSIPSPVSNMDDSDFTRELQNVLAGGTPPLGGSDYAGGAVPLPAATLESDIFDELPCSDNFCIRVRMVPGNVSLLSGGQSYSIESLIDKHTSIMERVANSNLSAQRMSTQSYQQLNLEVIMKNWLAQNIYLDTNSPQESKNTKPDQTQEEFEKEFEEIRRCSYASAGLNSDIKKSNILCGVGYQMDMTNNSENTVGRSEKNICAVSPEDTELLRGNCMNIALRAPRASYYESFATDIIELDAFNSALVEMLSQAVESQKLLDKKPRY